MPVVSWILMAMGALKTETKNCGKEKTNIHTHTETHSTDTERTDDDGASEMEQDNEQSMSAQSKASTKKVKKHKDTWKIRQNNKKEVGIVHTGRIVSMPWENTIPDHHHSENIVVFPSDLDYWWGWISPLSSENTKTLFTLHFSLLVVHPPWTNSSYLFWWWDKSSNTLICGSEPGHGCPGHSS